MNPIGALQRYAIIALVLIIAGGAFGGWERHQGIKQGEATGNARVAALQAEYAQATAKAEAAARAKEQASADQMAAVDAQHAQELQHAKQDADAVIADLRAGTLRLRRQWRGCETAASVPAPGASVASPDAAAEQRSEGARDLVRIAAEADSEIRALQAIVKADRGEP